MGIVIICFPVCDVKNVEINPNFLIKPFSYMTKKVVTEIWITWERKELLTWNEKYFTIIFKGIPLKLTKRNFLEVKSPSLI